MQKENIPVGRARISRMLTEMPVKQLFGVRVSEFVVAIQLVDSQTRHVDIIAPASTYYNWLEGTAYVLPRGYELWPKEEDTWMYMIGIHRPQ